jgi:autotransporter translocation and assembly factor TamB
MTLFEIKDQYLTLMGMDLDEVTLRDTLESLDGDLEDKADNIAYLIKSLKCEAEAIKGEAKTLQERAKAKEIKADKLTQYLFDTMKQLDKPKIETARNVLSIKKNPVSVVTLDGFYHDEYMNEVVEIRLDKAKLKEDLKAGVVVDGAWLEQKERLEVK